MEKLHYAILWMHICMNAIQFTLMSLEIDSYVYHE